jgi:multidrug efflux pump subunit AcrA (membrane-fusion protein)
MPMNGMSPMDRKSAMEKAKAKLAEAKRRAEDLEKQLAELRKKLENGALSDAERKALEAQKRALEASKKEAEAAQRDAAQQIQDLQLSPEAEAVFRKMREHPLYKELQEMAAKMKADAKGAAGGKRPQLTKEEIEAMRRKLEEFAKAMQDEKALEAYLQALKEAMESGASMGRCNGVCMGLGGIPLPGAGGPGADDDSMVFDSGKVNQLEQGRKGAGKTQTTGVRGLMRETPEEDPYIEIKAPATVGNRSSVPYVQVLPSYRKKAESALDRQQIPKEHQKRVREYFNSLGK